MKKLIISSLFIFFAATTVLRADTNIVKFDGGSEKISSSVLQHFGYTFYRASDVNWTVNSSYQKATFILNGKTTYALYDLSNKFLVATQLANVSDLPAAAQETLKKDYADYQTDNILKVVSRPADYQMEDDTNAYWLDLSKGNEHVIAIVFPKSDLRVVKTEKND